MFQRVTIDVPRKKLYIPLVTCCGVVVEWMVALGGCYERRERERERERERKQEWHNDKKR